MCVKNNREVNDGKRVAKRQDVFNIVRLGTFCLEKSVHIGNQWEIR